MPEIDKLLYMNIKRHILLAALAVMALPCDSHVVFADDAVSAPQFFSSMQDVPLMPGLVEVEDRSFSFDKPEGQIIQVTALIDDNYTKENVLYFYNATLPQFGWGRVSDLRFFRQDEHLDISFEDEGAQRFVKINMKPAL